MTGVVNLSSIVLPLFDAPEKMLNTDRIDIGAAGMSYGNSWEEKGCSDIVQIFISYDTYIQSLQLQYCENGSLVLSDRHGNNTANKFEAVQFDHPREYLTCVSGSYNHFVGGLTSITFTSNLSTYGPFGELRTCDTKFEFQLGKDRQFGGFFGRADSQVRSIGVHIIPNINHNQCGCPVLDEVIQFNNLCPCLFKE